MWIVRFLNGPMAGQIIPLSKRTTLIGRSPTCDIKIASPSISKEHTKIEVFDDKLIISDNGSRNGTFLNGVQVRSSKAKAGDKIALHDVFFEVQNVPDSWAARLQQQQFLGNLAYQQQPLPPPMPHPPTHQDPVESSSVALDFLQGRFPQAMVLANEYMDRVVLPGLYRLPEMFEFKWVLAGFMALFVLIVTTFSTIPMVRILKSSIEEESQQHAMTIAMTLARVNRPFLVGGQESSTSVDIASSRPGVKKALIISNIDGNIISPATQAGSYPEIPFVHEARKFNKEAVKQIDDNTVVAMYPILVFNQDTGAQAVTHWAVVLYDMKSLAVNDGQVLSLFITTLFFALILSFLLYYVFYKLVEHPIRVINTQLDAALKEQGETVSISYKFPAMELLASNVSSALSRALHGSQDGGANKTTEHDRNREITNVVELMGFAAVGIRAHDLSIAAANQAFEARIGQPVSQLTTLTLNELNDQSLKLSIKDLIERVDQNPDEMAANELEFSGMNFQVVAQAVYGSTKIAYYLIVLLPKSEGE